MELGQKIKKFEEQLFQLLYYYICFEMFLLFTNSTKCIKHFSKHYFTVQYTVIHFQQLNQHFTHLTGETTVAILFSGSLLAKPDVLQKIGSLIFQCTFGLKTITEAIQTEARLG